MGWRSAVETITVLIMLGGGGITLDVFKGTIALSIRTLQYLAIAFAVPAVLILSFERSFSSDSSGIVRDHCGVHAGRRREERVEHHEGRKVRREERSPPVLILILILVLIFFRPSCLLSFALLPLSLSPCHRVCTSFFLAGRNGMVSMPGMVRKQTMMKNAV